LPRVGAPAIGLRGTPLVSLSLARARERTILPTVSAKAAASPTGASGTSVRTALENCSTHTCEWNEKTK
jgi:hypothetical protein